MGDPALNNSELAALRDAGFGITRVDLDHGLVEARQREHPEEIPPECDERTADNCLQGGSYTKYPKSVLPADHRRASTGVRTRFRGRGFRSSTGCAFERPLQGHSTYFTTAPERVTNSRREGCRATFVLWLRGLVAPSSQPAVGMGPECGKRSDGVLSLR